MLAMTGGRSVPRVFINGQFIGGLFLYAIRPRDTTLFRHGMEGLLFCPFAMLRLWNCARLSLTRLSLVLQEATILWPRRRAASSKIFMMRDHSNPQARAAKSAICQKAKRELENSKLA